MYTTTIYTICTFVSNRLLRAKETAPRLLLVAILAIKERAILSRELFSAGEITLPRVCSPRNTEDEFRKEVEKGAALAKDTGT